MNAATADVGHSRRRRLWPLPLPPTMFDPGLPWLPRSVVEALGTGEIHSQTVREDRTARPKVRLFPVIHSFLAEILLEVDLVPGLERAMMVGLDRDRRMLLMH